VRICIRLRGPDGYARPWRFYGYALADRIFVGISRRRNNLTVLDEGKSVQATEERVGSVSAMPPAALEHWMSRYQQSDPAAPGALVESIALALLRFFRRNSASRELAEDLLQETFLKIHRMRRSYRPGEAVLPWVYAIARNVRVDNYRRVRRIMAHEVATNVPPEAAGQKEDLVAALEFDALVARLPEAQREVIVMLKVTGMTVEEVAMATSSTVGMVKLKAHRAYESGLRAASRTHAGNSRTYRAEPIGGAPAEALRLLRGGICSDFPSAHRGSAGNA
jgi:RNA polymerase sigma-70 factor (ECF subfamily)